LFTDPELIAVSSALPEIAKALEYSVSRPPSPLYAQLSDLLQRQLNGLLTAEPEKTNRDVGTATACLSRCHEQSSNQKRHAAQSDRGRSMTVLLALPALLLMAVVFGWPMLRYAWLSFHADSVLTGLVPVPNGGANWLRLLTDSRFWLDAGQTTRFAIVSVGLELILALAIALLLDQRWRGRSAVRALSLLPWALPTTMMALGWRWIFNTPYGPIEQVAEAAGFGPLNLLSTPAMTWIVTVLADVWKTTPFITLILLAGLQTIPEDLYAAFRLEGGSAFQALRRVTIPLLMPYILLSLLFRMAQAFGVFDLIQVLTGGGPAGSTESLALYAYLNGMRFLDFGYSATVMVGGFLLLTALILLGALLLRMTGALRAMQP
jgi:multiple sugar transport system permease protein